MLTDAKDKHNPTSTWAKAALKAAIPRQFDVLVLGAGLAGLRAAIRARSTGCSVAIAHIGRGASPFIIGCNAPFGHANAADTPAQYFNDTVNGGYGLSDHSLVNALSSGATQGIKELDQLGVAIAKNGNLFAQRQLSGNWYPRSVYHPRGLGTEMLARLSIHATVCGIHGLNAHKAVRLLSDSDGVHGALLFDMPNATWVPVMARSVVLALGGLGHLYLNTTYPREIMATSYAMAYEAGATLIDMEFVQFEPLCAFDPPAIHGLEMPTSMLAEGAQLLNNKGERFMFRHNPKYGEQRIEKALLALCIQEEIDQGRGVDGGVLYDATRVPLSIVEGYERHCKRLRHAGIDPAKIRIPIKPAAHSQMGGVRIDKNGFTGIAGLYAAGEAAGGLHGASRIAGNGGADALVFGDLAGAHAARANRPLVNWEPYTRAAFALMENLGEETGDLDAEVIKQRVREAMTEHVGIYRSSTGLNRCLTQLGQLSELLRSRVRALDDAGHISAHEAHAMLIAGRSVASSSLMRTESRGAHQRLDWPAMDQVNWNSNIAIRQGLQGEMRLTAEPIQHLSVRSAV